MKALKQVEGIENVTEVYFYAYIAKTDEKELLEVNEKLLSNVSCV